jgi:hypothetical protein
MKRQRLVFLIAFCAVAVAFCSSSAMAQQRIAGMEVSSTADVVSGPTVIGRGPNPEWGTQSAMEVVIPGEAFTPSSSVVLWD